MAAPSFPPVPEFAPRDIVRCMVDVTSGPALPVLKGHIYTVRAFQPAPSLDAAQEARGPFVWLEGFPQAFLAARFVLVARAPANDDPCQPAAIPRQMAQVFRDCVAARGCCDVHDLARAGFTAGQITEYADEARRLAGPLSSDGGEAA